jgi:hypothetical protein
MLGYTVIFQETHNLHNGNKYNVMERHAATYVGLDQNRI